MPSSVDVCFLYKQTLVMGLGVSVCSLIRRSDIIGTSRMRMVWLSILYVHFRDRNVLLSLHQCFLHVIFMEFISQCVHVIMQILIVWTAVLYCFM